MSQKGSWLHRRLPAIVALALVALLFQLGRLPSASASELARTASGFAFQPASIAMPGGYPQQTVRKVNQKYQDINAWISSVGSGVAMNDLDGDGLPNDLCITDPRIDQVVVTPVPRPGTPRYAPFALNPAPLPMSDTMAPMGCVPGDFNEDGRTDVLVYLWGRTPILYLAKAGAVGLTMDTFRPVEVLPQSPGDRYDGPQWNTNTVAVDDFDGDGHVDIFVGNYFPHGPVLDDTKKDGVAMNHSMSQAFNGGEDYFFRCTGATAGAEPTATFELVSDVLPRAVSKGWALAAAANDVDGDLLPELYVAHDFGPDRMLYNRSTPGKIEFAPVKAVRDPLVPKSKRVGADSFKGMGVDFGDLDGDGLYDMYVSNIATTFGLEESHFAFVNSAKDHKDLRTHLDDGTAPFKDESAPLGLAWSGWGWDVKMADFNNSGDLVVAQTTGFVKGEVNRWPQLQELAMSNDNLLTNTTWWPHVRPGDDIGGSQRLHFFVKSDGGRYVDIAPRLGLDAPVPTRGIATGDADGDGRLDFAVARQWDEPVFYHNQSPNPGAFLGLRLTHPAPAGATAATGTAGSPVVGAQVKVTTADGRVLLGRVDGGSGHSGKRSSEVHIGLGKNVTGPVRVELNWRDRTGQPHQQELSMTPGWHSLELGAQAQER
ncbi:CRTAC1 family protein [Micromonospora sp. PSH03]|uniref:CRTAC1 family protein n=1 Tax=Micromonospora TaxID=1873 RepID=UPI001B378195|nr:MULTISPECIES: CRTAC1 family protein [Micromonospora]MBQ0988641.1 CRTAC1 family protein [Micromonospora sp. H61]MCG5454812.1 CRTAC1 family protein [Micromonospora salmantinae]